MKLVKQGRPQFLLGDGHNAGAVRWVNGPHHRVGRHGSGSGANFFDHVGAWTNGEFELRRQSWQKLSHFSRGRVGDSVDGGAIGA